MDIWTAFGFLEEKLSLLNPRWEKKEAGSGYSRDARQPQSGSDQGRGNSYYEQDSGRRYAASQAGGQNRATGQSRNQRNHNYSSGYYAGGQGW